MISVQIGATNAHAVGKIGDSRPITTFV